MKPVTIEQYIINNLISCTVWTEQEYWLAELKLINPNVYEQIGGLSE